MVNILDLEKEEVFCPYCKDYMRWNFKLELWICDSCRIHL